MKKVILSIAVLAAISTTSCKKAYECACTETNTYEYVSNDADYDDWVESENEDNAEYTPDTRKYTNTLDKTSKAEANANCPASATTTNTSVYFYDSEDKAGVYEVETTKTECSLEKK